MFHGLVVPILKPTETAHKNFKISSRPLLVPKRASRLHLAESKLVTHKNTSLVSPHLRCKLSIMTHSRKIWTQTQLTSSPLQEHQEFIRRTMMNWTATSDSTVTGPNKVIHRKGEPWGVLMLNQVKRPCAWVLTLFCPQTDFCRTFGTHTTPC
jgi:hypothetical protein